MLIRVPLSWLREYVDVTIPVDDLALRLHMSGTEVKGIERKAWKDIWVGEIAELEKHPNADKLQLATVEYGGGRRRTVVTGATNLTVGALVPYAELGARYVDGHTGEPMVMKAKNMRGVTSEGMVLSEKELGLGEDHDGIMLLDKSLSVGAALAEVIGQTVLLLELQPNRPDCVGIVGIAREIAALLDRPLREPGGDELDRHTPSALDVRIEDPAACPRFAAARLDGIKIGPSPKWLQERLVAAGMRPISNVVDITNYVMLELGQPLHAYDLRAIRGGTLVARQARARSAGVVDRYPRPRSTSDVRLPFAKIDRHLGIAVPPADAVRALERLGFDVRRDGDALVARAPVVRTDIAIPEDLIEEIARTIGYDKLSTRMPSGPLPVPESHPREALRERVRDLLVGFGLQDTISYAAIDPAWLTRLTHDGACIAPEPLRIVNPTTVAQSVMRSTLRPSLLDTAVRNLRFRSGVAFFEIAPVYLPRSKELPEERWTIGVLLAGNAEPAREAETWLTKE